MYVLDLLKRSSPKAAQAIEGVTFEYRLLCSGELYNANVIAVDWRKSDATRLLVDGPFTLTVCSHPFDDYPQELSLRFQTARVTETKGKITLTFYPDEEIAHDIASILSLLLRRFITVSAKVREIHPRCYEQEPDWLLDISIDFANRISRDYWRHKPASIVYDNKGINDIINYNPPPRGLDPRELRRHLTALASSHHAESLVLAARLYSQALSQIEHESDLAYQSLISCVETIANKALSEYRPDEAKMIETKKKVCEMATEFGLEPEQCKALAIKACSGISWATEKFTKFLVDNTGSDLWEKDDLFQVDQLFCPKQDELEAAIRKIYAARGGATHWGQPYPSSIAIGTGPTAPFNALLDFSLEKADAPLTPIPPTVWFERLANFSINNFIRKIATDEIHEQLGQRRQKLEPRLNIVTLGVKNLDRAVRFYRDGLGWPLSSISAGDFAIFKMSTGTALALYPRHLLAKDACAEDCGGYGGITLAQNVSSKEEVDRALSQAVLAGGTLLKEAHDTEWGGYSGYFADPDGHPWEVAWAPVLELRQGKLVLPD